jgi:hypothetical protein
VLEKLGDAQVEILTAAATGEELDFTSLAPRGIAAVVKTYAHRTLVTLVVCFDGHRPLDVTAVNRVADRCPTTLGSRAPQADRSMRMHGAELVHDAREHGTEVHRGGMDRDATADAAPRQVEDLLDHPGHPAASSSRPSGPVGIRASSARPSYGTPDHVAS